MVRTAGCDYNQRCRVYESKTKNMRIQQTQLLKDFEIKSLKICLFSLSINDLGQHWDIPGAAHKSRGCAVSAPTKRDPYQLVKLIVADVTFIILGLSYECSHQNLSISKWLFLLSDSNPGQALQHPWKVNQLIKYHKDIGQNIHTKTQASVLPTT